MDFKTISRIYPRGRTLCGDFFMDGELSVKSWDTLLEIDSWKDNPFAPVEGSIPFLIYLPRRNVFEVWWFSYDVVYGYYTENGEDWDVVVLSESFGYERYDPFCTSHWVFGPPTIHGQSRQHQIVEAFDSEAFDNGYVFTNEEEIKDFARRMKMG